MKKKNEREEAAESPGQAPARRGSVELMADGSRVIRRKGYTLTATTVEDEAGALAVVRYLLSMAERGK